MKAHFIQQDAWVLPGEYLAWAERRGYDVTVTKCWEYERIPESAEADMLVVLGGYQCPATTKEECGYFDAEQEKALIRSYVEAGRMVVGVCLGAQLVGEALGAPYAHSPEREIGPVEARLTPEGKNDPFFAAFGEVFPAGEWHNDMPGLTEDSAVIAESDGCPRQIVRYGRYVYGFQTHMEFTHEIVAAGIEEAGGRLNCTGRFVQTEEQLLAYDYSGMNALLSSFLDAMAEEYRREHAPTVSQVMEKMIAFSEGNIHDIDHLIRVWTYAKTIGELEGLDADTQYLLEVAAITHDIACPLCREKYGNTNGRHQEEEGALMVRTFLSDCGMCNAQIDRVSYLVGHHHSFSGIDGRDWQILIEADYIANATENGYSRENAANFISRIMKTGSGKRIAEAVFQLS
ncbi:MAG: HD domain-containing protein [Oscillospiraceae bacterium]|nr:HD domain-containing protein [Oscillospiraceae bacterium]